MTATLRKADAVAELAARAERAINAHEAAGTKLVGVVTTLTNLERDRARQKSAAIARMVQQENPATPGKPYSASQAADFALLDKDYASYKQQVQSFTLLKMECEVELETAKLEATYAIALFRSAGGLT